MNAVQKVEPMDAFERALRELNARGETLSRTQRLSRDRFADEYASDQHEPDELIHDYRNIRGE